MAQGAQFLSNQLAEQVRQALVDNNFSAVTALVPSGISLGAALELAIAKTQWRDIGNTEALACFNHLTAHLPLLKRVSESLGVDQVRFEPTDVALAPDCDTFSIQPGVQGDAWNQAYYSYRFSHALKRNGFENKLADGLACALGEMLDNLGFHSGAAQGTSAVGLAVYTCQPGQMSFAVGDMGVGVLHSLRRAERWQNLASHREALLKAVTQNATSRPGFVEGSGFRTVYHSIIELEGRIRFRSGSGAVEVSQTKGGNKQITSDSSVFLEGLQLEVSCIVGNGRNAPPQKR